MEFDYVIVGAGSAGCAIANRLSARSDISVALLEAGGEDRSPWIHIPVGYFKTMGGAAEDVGLAAEAWGRLEMLCVALAARALKYDSPKFPLEISTDPSVLKMPPNIKTSFRPPRRVFSYYAPMAPDGSDVPVDGPFEEWIDVSLLNPMDGKARQPNETIPGDVETVTRFLDRVLDGFSVDWEKRKRAEREKRVVDPNAYVVGSTVVTVPTNFKRL